MHHVDPAIKQRAIHRLKIIQGQLAGLVKAIETEEYCPTLLAQSLSIQHSLKSLDALLLENHLRSHVREQLADVRETDRAVKELIKIFTLSNK